MVLKTVSLLICFTASLCIPVVGQSLTAAEAAEKIRQATPDALPQTPVIKKARLDSEDDGLHGRVKYVSISVEESSGSRIRSEVYYDKGGNITTRVLYDHRGNPSAVFVYGFLDGKRVWKTRHVSYQYPSGSLPPPGSRPEAKPASNERYDYSAEYKYDRSGKLVETITYSSTGKVSIRATYTYEANKRERITYDHKGQVGSITKETYDSKNNLVESIFPARDSFGEGVSLFKYEKFDSGGNWTRRVVSGKAGSQDGGQSDFRQTETRVITYH